MFSHPIRVKPDHRRRCENIRLGELGLTFGDGNGGSGGAGRPRESRDNWLGRWELAKALE